MPRSSYEQIEYLWMNPVYMEIIEKMGSREVYIAKLALDFEKNVATVQKQLEILRERGLVVKRKQKKYSFYRVTRRGIKELHKSMEYQALRSAYLTELDRLKVN